MPATLVSTGRSSTRSASTYRTRAGSLAVADLVPTTPLAPESRQWAADVRPADELSRRNQAGLHPVLAAFLSSVRPGPVWEG